MARLVAADIQPEDMKITALDAATWINNAWNHLSGTTITRCFMKCGLQVTGLDPEDTTSTAAQAMPELTEIEALNYVNCDQAYVSYHFFIVV